MNQRTFLQDQVVQLRRLLDEAKDDPVLAPQLQQRLEDVKGQLRAVEPEKETLFPMEPILPRVALFLKGAAVRDSEGIRPALAGDALIQYERMFTEQALHDEREAARAAGRARRRRGSPNPSLLFTGTPRGSFGLEFAPQLLEDRELLPVHAKSLQNIADALLRVSSAEANWEQTIESILPRVLQPMKQFLRTLAQHGAEVRLAFSDGPSKSIDADRIKRVSERLEQEWEEEEIQVTGVLRGFTWETTVFDVRRDDGTVISGTIADSFTEEDFERIAPLTNHRCIAKLQVTTLKSVTGSPRQKYLLLDAIPEDTADETTGNGAGE
jgi:hypothetical protein